MAKVLNQLLYSSIIYGNDQPSGSLRLMSTSAGMKGAIEVVGSRLDLIVDNQIGRLVHANQETRTYRLPDYSGQVLVSGLFTAAGQLLYSASAGVYAALAASLGGALVTSATGELQWVTGTEGQVLTVSSAGEPSFADIPNTGTIEASSAAYQLPYYVTAGNVLSPLATTANRALLSGTTTLGWSLISTAYLAASGNIPLTQGTLAQFLTSNGDGTFAWVNPNPAVINAGTQFRLPYYSGASPSTAISESTFIVTNEAAKAISLINRGTLRLHEAEAYGTSYVELKAPLSLGASLALTLPSADGLAGSFLQTDGLGNLSFVYVDNGTVAAGLINQIAYYSVDGNDVSGLTTVSSRIMGSTALGALSWLLIDPTHLSATGGVPLTLGTASQVLISTGDGNFAWATAVDLTGEVLSGVATSLAYYPATGTKVDDVSFLTITAAQSSLNVVGGAIRFFPSSGTTYVGLTAPSSLLASLTFSLPSADGLSGHALVTDGSGQLSFIKVGRGTVHTGAAKTFAYYDTAVDEVYSFANEIERVALTNSDNEILWDLITEKYLASSGSVPLSGGVNKQVLTSDGFGAFLWKNATDLTGKVDTGQATRLSYYTGTNTVAGSSWLNNAESQKALELLGGTLRIYEASDTYYAALAANPALTSSVQWYLPLADASSANQALISDAAGNLSFTMLVDTGSVNSLPYYSASHTVSGSSWLSLDESAKALKFVGGSLRLYTASGTYYAALTASLSLAANVSWSLPTTDASSANQALISDAAGHLSFKTLVDAGVQNAVAVYKNSTAPQVTPSANFFNTTTGLLLGGSTFTLAGDTGTTVRINSANNSSVILGAATSNLLSLDTGSLISVLYGATFRFFDSGIKYLGFKAPATVTNTVTWTLPAGDGSASQCLTTDGNGTLLWADIIAKNVITGTAGNLAYYSNVKEVSSSLLKLPVGLPAATLSSLLSGTDGQLSYKVLVTPSGTLGNIGVYTAEQTLGYYTNLNWNDSSKTLTLGLGGKIALANLSNTYATTLQSSPSLLNNLILTLPAALPLANGSVLAGNTDGSLYFADPSGDTTLVKKGVIALTPATRFVTVLYDEPFATTPAGVQTQWITSSGDLSYLPSYAVEQSTADGFIVKFSTHVPSTGDYKIFYQSYLTAATSLAPYVFMAGGATASGNLSSISSMAFDLDSTITTLSNTMAANRAYMTGGGGSASGYVFGGEDDLGGTTTISALNYTTTIFTDLTATLATERSGAAGVGTRSKCYVAGGETPSGSSYLTVESFVTALETVSTLSTGINNYSVRKGAATARTQGVVIDSDNNLNLFIYSTDTIVNAAILVAGDMKVGANNVNASKAYFGNDAGDLSCFDFVTSTVTALGASLSSTNGLSSAGNSLTKAYFAGDYLMEALSFATETTLIVASLPLTGLLSASAASFQSKGLL